MKNNLFKLAVSMLVVCSASANAAWAGYVVDGTKKGVKEGVGGTKKGVKEGVGGTKKGYGYAEGGTKKGIKEGVGGTKKGIKETKKFFKKVF